MPETFAVKLFDWRDPFVHEDPICGNVGFKRKRFYGFFDLSLGHWRVFVEQGLN